MSRIQTYPSDGFGYTLTDADLRFLAIGQESADNCVGGVSPLGMSCDQYGIFVKGLLEATWREGFKRADIRLQGSSVKFFSGPHKMMPYAAEEIHETFMNENKMPPEDYDFNEIIKAINRVWPAEPRPKRRPFDSLYKLGLSPEPSDYDVQISSDDAFSIVRTMLRNRNLDTDKLVVENTKYQFMRKEYSDKWFLHLQAFSAKWMKVLGRPVNIAVFDATGPAQQENSDLSSHFRETDWIIDPGKIPLESRQSLGGQATA